MNSIVLPLLVSATPRRRDATFVDPDGLPAAGPRLFSRQGLPGGVSGARPAANQWWPAARSRRPARANGNSACGASPPGDVTGGDATPRRGGEGPLFSRPRGCDYYAVRAAGAAPRAARATPIKTPPVCVCVVCWRIPILTRRRLHAATCGKHEPDCLRLMPGLSVCEVPPLASYIVDKTLGRIR